MSDVRDETLWEYALGSLPEPERLRVEQELQRSPSLVQRLAEVHAMLGGLETEAIAPSAPVKMRLMQSVQGVDAFAPLLDRLSRFIDLPVARTRDILRMLDTDEGWKPSVLPGLLQFDFPPGPALAGCEVGLVRLPAGFHFPAHRHVGEERVMVLKGAFVDRASNTLMQAGDVAVMAPGSSHSFDVVGGEAVLMAALSGPLDFD